MNHPSRVRMIAGPNGSGKSTLVHELRRLIPLGIYVNADDIEHTLRQKGILDLEDFSLDFSQGDFEAFALSSGWKQYVKPEDLIVRDHFLVSQTERLSSYHAALIADFFRHRLLDAKISFTFETVMSHPDKVAFLNTAKRAGYRTYLYFVATEDPSINIERVRARIRKGGHPVSADKIIARYRKSLELLPQAIRHCNRAFIFDNSLSDVELKVEVTDAKVLHLHTLSTSEWISEHVISKFSQRT